MASEAHKTYTKVISYGMNIGLRRFIETIVFSSSMFFATIMYLYLIIGRFSSIGLYIFFPTGLLFIITLILSFIANRHGMDIFGEGSNRFLTFMSFIAIAITVVYAVFPALFVNPITKTFDLSLVVIFYFLLLIQSMYFITSSTKTEASSTFGLEQKFKALEQKLEKRKISELKLEKVLNKGVEALKVRVSQEGFWGELNTLYETACVLHLFHVLEIGLDKEWAILTEEGKEPFKLKTAYDNLYSIITSEPMIEMKYEKFYVLYVLSLYDQSIVDRYVQYVEQYKQELKEINEYEIINRLNLFNPNQRSKTTPMSIIMANIADSLGEIGIIDKLSNLFLGSVDVILKRGYSRFSTSKTGKTPIEMFARLLITLQDIRRMPPKKSQFVQAFERIQFIEGSWSGNVGTTGYVIEALCYTENTESLSLKKAALYLAAIQDKEGLWGANVEETVIALIAIKRILQLIAVEKGLEMF